VSHRSPLPQTSAAGPRPTRAALALVAAGALAVVGSCLIWRTVTTSSPHAAPLVLQRVSGLHFSRLGAATIGVGDITLVLGVLAIAVGAMMVRQGTLTMLVGALTGCALLVLALTGYETSTILRGNSVGEFSDRAGLGLWISLVACVTLCGIGVSLLITALRDR
jgi:hypothetical protein